MKKIDRIFIAFVIACGLTLVALKAVFSALTTDEAWNYNHWISAGFHTILTDYSAFNNHILQTFLSRVSINILGVSEFAQRCPSMLAYILFAFTFVKLVERTISDRALRLISIILVLLHPYILDFASLARGYMLMMALSTAGVYFMVESFDTSRPRRNLPFLALASCAIGMSAATVPSAVRLLPAFLLILLLQPMTNSRMPLRPIHLIAALMPAMAVAAAFYIPVMHTARDLSIDFGTKSWIESLQSLRMIFFYTPSAALDAGGNPAANPESMLLWSGQTATRAIHLVLAGKAAFTLFAAALACIALLPFRYRSGRSAFSVHIIWISVLALILIERYVSGSRLPMGRAWLAVAPFPIISAFSLVECLITGMPARSQRRTLTLVGALAVLLLGIRIDNFNVLTYQEWPDNSVSASIIEDLSKLMPPGGTASVSCPLYYHACLSYYADRAGLRDLEVRAGHKVPATYHLLREDLLDEPVPDGLVVTRYQNLSIVLARDVSTPIQR